MVEAKCAAVNAKRAATTFDDGQPQPRQNYEQWQALIALHRTLLREHHDFFLASQHPGAQHRSGSMLCQLGCGDMGYTAFLNCFGIDYRTNLSIY